MNRLSPSALGKLFVAPGILLMLAVALGPILYAFVLSFANYDGRRRDGWAGFDNYVRAFTDADFWAAFSQTIVFTLTSVSLEFVVGLTFALAMNVAIAGRGLLRATILVPWVIPTVVAAQMWSILLNVQPGFVNSWLGLGNFNWLGSPGWAMASIVLADVWKTAPFVALLLLAGLQTISNDLYESARLDGANALQRLWYITFPGLLPAIMVALLFRTVDALRVFDLPKVMTHGQFGTESLSMFVQRYVIETVDLGYGSALSALTFVLVLGVGVVFVLLLNKKSNQSE